MLQITGLRKTYGNNVVLDDLDLAADEHTCTALIGASGSGKSTLLRCINLLEVVDDGVIELDGRDITDPRVDANEVRTQVGIVFQSFNLFPHLRVLDNVSLALRRVHKMPRGAGRGRGRRHARARRPRATRRRPARTSCPAASSSASRSPARSSPGRA